MFEKALWLAYVGNHRTTTSAVDQQGLTFFRPEVPGHCSYRGRDERKGVGEHGSTGL
jgi:hypothetical protein